MRFEPPQLALKPLRPLGSRLAARSRRACSKRVTGTALAGRPVATKPASPRCSQQEKIAEEKVRADLLADPNVAAVIDAFPEAELEPHNQRRLTCPTSTKS